MHAIAFDIDAYKIMCWMCLSERDGILPFAAGQFYDQRMIIVKYLLAPMSIDFFWRAIKRFDRRAIRVNALKYILKGF